MPRILTEVLFYYNRIECERVLFPEKDLIRDNILNNNSLVFKFECNTFKMLFTGDIEAVAEEKLLKLYKNDELKSDILKVAHHGSKTSSIDKFIKAVNPKIALIGVGGNNKFGHPDHEVIGRLEKNGIQIYRTDEMGEINIKISTKGEVDFYVNL